MMLRQCAWIWLVALLPLGATGPDPVVAQNGMVSSRSMLASQVGMDIMRKGGNAVDATVATGFALAVTYPSAGNIGGGGFMVIRTPDNDVVTLDFREKAPAAADRDMYLDDDGNIIDNLSTRSHKASGVPGSVAGLLAAHARYGTLTRKQVLAPAIALATGGFELNRDLAGQFERQLRFMKDYPASMAIFSLDGKPYKAGEVWTQTDLGETLKRISQAGRDGFYKGKTAELIVAEMERGGGLITAEDLAKYEPVWREPIHGTYRGHDIWSMPPPSSGGVLVVQMLNMLEPHDLGAMGWGSAAATHLMIEAQRRAYADRAEYLGDPDFVDVPSKKLIDKAYAIKRAADIHMDKASDSDKIGAGQWPTESTETTHYSVVDAKGWAVACTTTLNWGYGNRVVVAGAGFLLNNEMDDFSVKHNTPNTYGLIGRQANEIQPGKRMLSSMTPTILTKDDQLFLVTGSPGGSTIINTVLEVIVNVVDHDMNISQAVSAPRFHHQWKPNRVLYEAYGLSPDTLAILRKMGHQDLTEMRWQMGDANTIMVTEDGILGMSDPRNVGGSSGY